MIVQDVLAKLPHGAILINVARGRLVVEEDLVAAGAASQALGCHGVDVTPEEPLPMTSQLWDLPNLIIHAHVGGQSRRRIDQMTDFFCEESAAYQARKAAAESGR